MAGDFTRMPLDGMAKIMVLGVGGCGNNAITHMIDGGLMGAELVAANTDVQALSLCAAAKSIQIGEKTAGGLGVGCNPDRGRKAAEESIDRIVDEFAGYDMLFLAGGMGGGTGTGGLPLIAQAAKEKGILTVAVVTKPFVVEGAQKMKLADDGVRQLEEFADSVIVIPNQRVMELDKKMNFKKARAMIDDILFRAVKGIVEIIQFAGEWNVDMNDVRTIMRGRGRALMGMGFARGEDKAQIAVGEAVASPLVEDVSINGCTGGLINITVHPDEFTLGDYEQVMSALNEHASKDATIKCGVVFRDDMEDAISVTVIATGFERAKPHEQQSAAVRRSSEPLFAARGAAHDARACAPAGAPHKVRRMTESGQVSIPINYNPEDFSVSEEVTSIPAYISQLQKAK